MLRVKKECFIVWNPNDLNQLPRGGLGTSGKELALHTLFPNEVPPAKLKLNRILK